MIMRGGGATGLAGAAGCICITLLGAGGAAAGGALALAVGAAGTEGLTTRGGTAIAGGGAVAAGELDGGVAETGGKTGAFGGITTTDGGR
jgi:hypothetical protein